MSMTVKLLKGSYDFVGDSFDFVGGYLTSTHDPVFVANE